LSGLTEGRDIDIVFTGLKPGEKLHEELFMSTERPERSRHPKIFVCDNGYKPTLSSIHAGPNFSGISGLPPGDGNPQLRQTVQELIEAAQLKSVESVEELVRTIVPEYQGHSHASPVLAATDEARSVS